MDDVRSYLCRRVNTGPFLTCYTLPELKRRAATDRMVLPICSLGTPVEALAELAPLVLPPLYHEALDEALKAEMLQRIGRCFPYYEGTRDRSEFDGRFEVVELSPERHDAPPARVLAFSFDTAVEEHGPHLPLSTDTIQSYGVLARLAEQFDGLALGPPGEYGHLTWGLPFGMSIDLTPPLLERYVTGFANAVVDWAAADALYVVDVHGSIVHRTAIQKGLAASRAKRYAFRWLHEPLVELAGDRGDQHAGGVETALVAHISPALIDANWWPGRREQIAELQMPMQQAVELSADLPRLIEQVEAGSLNGIVGDVNNFDRVDADVMMRRMLDVAAEDVRALMAS